MLYHSVLMLLFGIVESNTVIQIDMDITDINYKKKYSRYVCFLYRIYIRGAQKKKGLHLSYYLQRG